MLGETRGQHHLPQFLLRGFSSRSNGKQAFTFLTLRGKEPFETNVKNVGKRRDFYGSPDSSNTEVELARIETDLAKTVTELRRGGEVPADRIRTLIVNLQIRSANFRNIMTDATETMLSRIEKLFDHDGFVAKIQRDVLAEIERKFTQGEYAPLMRGSDVQLEQLLAVAEHGLRTDFMNFLGQLKQGFSEARRDYHPESAIAAAHVNALSKGLAPEARLAAIEHLTWSTLSLESDEFILGDVGPTIRRKESPVLVHSLETDAEVVELLLPISSRVLLRGMCGVPSEVSIEEVNLSQAQLSSELLVSANTQCRPGNVLKELGKHWQPYDSAFFDQVLEETIRDKRNYLEGE